MWYAYKPCYTCESWQTWERGILVNRGRLVGRGILGSVADLSL